MKPCNKKTAIVGLIIILAMTTLTILVLKKQFNMKEVISAICSAQITWLIPAAVCMLTFNMGESFNIYQGLKLSGYKPPVKDAVKYGFAGFFFSSITPSASGGQPAQLYFMSRDNISLSHGSFALLLELMGFEIASISLGFMGILVSVFSDIRVFNQTGLIWLALVGFSVNFLLLILLLTVMFSRKAAKVLAATAVKITFFFTHNPDSKKKVFTLISEYRWAAIKARKNKKVFFKVILVSLFRLFAYHSITYFTYRALGLSGQGLFEITFLQGLLFTSVSCIPLPGSSGAMEGGFGLLFKSIFPSALLGSGILLSRIMSFALPLIYTGLSIIFLSKKKSRNKL